MRKASFNAISENLDLIRSRTKRVWITATVLTIVSALPFLGIVFFDWEGWMVLFNYYIELWLLGFAVFVKYLAIRFRKPRLSDPEKKFRDAGRNIAMGAGFLLLFGVIAFVDNPGVESKGEEIQFYSQIINVYFVQPFQGWDRFLFSAFFALIAIVVHHVFSYQLNFNPHRNNVSADAFYKQTSKAGWRMINMSLLMFFSLPAVLMLSSMSKLLERLFGDGAKAEWIGENLGFLIPIALIVLKTYVDVKAHIRSDTNWVGDGGHEELFGD
jgi:hypothetical protein